MCVLHQNDAETKASLLTHFSIAANMLSCVRTPRIYTPTTRAILSVNRIKVFVTTQIKLLAPISAGDTCKFGDKVAR